MTKLEEKIKDMVFIINFSHLKPRKEIEDYLKNEIQSLLTQQSELKDAVIAKQDEYIKFLSEDIERNAGFLFAHNIICPKSEVEQGKNLRQEISELKSKSIGVEC